MPEDLLKFGLIPEFIGRLPVIVTLSALTAEDLVRVLTEPKNAVTRQFQQVPPARQGGAGVHARRALVAAADVALDRKTGARALRSIVEEALLEVMYDIPERTDIRKCIITEETIRAGRLPLLLTKSDVDKGVDETNYEEWLAERAESAAQRLTTRRGGCRGRGFRGQVGPAPAVRFRRQRSHGAPGRGGSSARLSQGGPGPRGPASPRGPRFGSRRPVDRARACFMFISRGLGATDARERRWFAADRRP